MGGLLKKYSYNYLLYTVPFLIFKNVHFLTSSTRTSMAAYIFILFWMWLILSGAITSSEKYEEKNNGLKLLKTLPLSSREIVVPKFILSFVTTVILTVNSVILIAIFKSDSDYSTFFQSITVIFGAACLIYAGVIYLLIVKIGLTRVVNWVWVLLIPFMGVIAFKDVLFNNLKFTKENLIRFGSQPWWILFVIVALGLFYFFMKKSVSILENKEEV